MCSLLEVLGVFDIATSSVKPTSTFGQLGSALRASPQRYTDEHEYPDPTRAFQAGRQVKFCLS